MPGKNTGDSGLSAVANTYNRFPVTLVKGKGCTVWDDAGREYVDFAAGIAVCSLGHCHPEVTRAVADQVGRLVHVSNLYWTLPQQRVAGLLTENSFGDRVFFCNSGAEAVEAAIKLARRYGHDTRGPECHEVICLEGSFHGRTLAAVAATGQPVYQKGFEPMPDGFVHCPFNDIQALEAAAGRETAAILLEPIQGEGGVRLVDDDFLRAARNICDRLGALLIFDEVQVGIGRAGTLFAYEQTPVIPDVICLAKALGNGFPIGAMMAGDEVMAHLPPGSHASTFGGNPVACAAAEVVINTMISDGFLEGVVKTGSYLRERLGYLASEYPDRILEVRGKGLIQALVFREEEPNLAGRLLEAGFLVIFSHGKVLRMVPPLIVTEAEIDALAAALRDVLKGQSAASQA
ncbi:MAG TPA: aspartate aminotransferase family protein [Thermodesulfobacteriaceae bacterium]|nr:aspartate aminotransferase family protein [Thermodesulfobacteriaceae bacterium]